MTEAFKFRYFVVVPFLHFTLLAGLASRILLYEDNSDGLTRTAERNQMTVGSTQLVCLLRVSLAADRQQSEKSVPEFAARSS